MLFINHFFKATTNQRKNYEKKKDLEFSTIMISKHWPFSLV